MHMPLCNVNRFFYVYRLCGSIKNGKDKCGGCYVFH